MRNISDKIVEKIITQVLYRITFFQKLCRALDNEEKCGAAREATDDIIIWHMRFLCWVIKATYTLRIWNIYCFFTATVDS